MSFIKHGDGKIVSVITDKDLTSEVKKMSSEDLNKSKDESILNQEAIDADSAEKFLKNNRNK